MSTANTTLIEDTRMKPLCIYHKNCLDGFGAAWVFKRYADREFDFHEGVYQNDPPDVEGRDVYLVDFSYKRPIVEQLREKANRVVLIDHHKSALDDLMPLIESRLIESLVSLEHSGAVLVWRWFHGNLTAPPKFLEHIEDRDLWRFALPFTREINATLYSYPFSFDVFDELSAAPIDRLITEGTALTRAHNKTVDQIVRSNPRMMVIGGHNVCVRNVAPQFQSDVGNITAKGAPFSAMYQDTAEGRIFSLRSVDGGLDVSEIAKQYGGGGHKHAAGFKVQHGVLD